MTASPNGAAPRKRVVSHCDLEVYKLAFDAAMRIFRLSKKFPKEERYALTDQIRRCSRSVCGNVAEGWRKRRYKAAFVSKVNDAEGEAAETQSWIQFAVACEYWTPNDARPLYETYNRVLGILVGMINHHEKWVLPSALKR